MKITKMGFTLAELLMVVVIIGIFGAIALPRFFPQQEKARVSEAIGILSAIRQGELAYRLENTGYLAQTTATDATATAKWNQIGMDNPNTTANRKFTYLVQYTIGVDSFKAQATRMDGDYKDKCIVLDQSGTWSGNHPYGSGYTANFTCLT
ncbi:MAG TPA: prepilin-type N-terminal cleavage/methylation domain-containing protein [Candidatus Omnitrophota bacterium]|nr:prepilin-type N-terminal cleavage/methylation domain-containing protein [Candidatus Omnitrophota bacterium]HPS36724.1 prepilin-type N-terminal cleavage/methylation domain-containing protein [Candidatus Omnitrophota bacterium]